MKSHRIVLTVATALCAVLLQPAAGQTLYKSTMPDGRIVYGDKPAPGAAKVEETTPDLSKRGIGGSTPREQQVLKEMEKERLQREGAKDRIRAAEQKLRDAEAARDDGKEPLEGERIGTAGGSSRLNESYFERQRRLEENVEKARRELDRTRSGK
jgi:hypothetical protein